VKLLKLTIPILFLLFINSCKVDEIKPEIGWDHLDQILKNIVPPTFQDKSFNILDYGAIADGETDSRPAIEKAIAECSMEGGGKVVVPSGTYFSKGPIHMISNVNLHLEEGSLINFSIDSKDYLPVVFTRWEGVEVMNYSPLIYALDEENIAITGKGILDGQASSENWWSWKGKKEFGWKEGMPNQNMKTDRVNLMKMNENSTPVDERIFGDGHYLRPNFIQFYRCKNILMEDFTVKNSPMWIIHPVLSKNITIRGVKSIGPGPNNDGCDPESCKDVLIENCYFDNGDDCIAIKSGRNQDGRRVNVPSENIIVRNCKMKDGHGGIVMGSEISGGVRNVYLENCEMDSPNLDRAVRIKSNSYRGGIVENIFVRNVKVGEVGGAIVRLNMFYAPKEGSDGKFPPTFRNIQISNITSLKSKYGLRFEGIENSKIQNVLVKNCSFEGVEKGNIIENVENLKIEDVIINGEVVNYSK